MDRIQRLLREIQNDRSLMDIRYSSSFLNRVGEIFERYGFGTTKVFLLEKRSREADALLKIIDKIENENITEIVRNRSIGRMVIKTLITLKRTEV